MMNSPVSCNRQLQKYIDKRSVSAPWRIFGLSESKFSAAIVIPALAEYEHLPHTLSSLAKNPPSDLSKTLVVVVVNNRSDATVNQKDDNSKTLQWLCENKDSGLHLAWVDACSPGLELPEKEGVGLARKIGFDLSLQCLNWDSVPILISLDADTLVDERYLPAIFDHFSKTSIGGAVLPYRHQLGRSQEEESAIRNYELYLRSYLFGLSMAGSPYAYHTIGSAFACRADAYIAAAGMNRRKAGEDFYFLQQLSKTSGVEFVRGTVVNPSARLSNRVPFGTGKVVQAQVETSQFPCQYISLPSFQILEELLNLVAKNWNKPAIDLVDLARQVSLVLYDFLQELKFEQVWERLQRNHLSQDKMLFAFSLWFDALRTRQLLTRLENTECLCATNLVAELLNWGGYSEVNLEEDQLWLLEGIQGVNSCEGYKACTD